MASSTDFLNTSSVTASSVVDSSSNLSLSLIKSTFFGILQILNNSGIHFSNSNQITYSSLILFLAFLVLMNITIIHSFFIFVYTYFSSLFIIFMTKKLSTKIFPRIFKSSLSNNCKSHYNLFFLTFSWICLWFTNRILRKFT